MPMKPAAPETADDEDDGAGNGDGGILTLEIGLRAFAHRGGDFLHACGAGVGGQERLRRPDTVDDRQRAAGND
jgi:hypothetical protein